MLRKKSFRRASATLKSPPATPCDLASAGDAPEFPVEDTPFEEVEGFFGDVGDFLNDADELLDDSFADEVTGTPHRPVGAPIPDA